MQRIPLARRFLILVALLSVIIWATRRFLVQGWLVPVRLASNSMAPALIGPHQLLVCHNCGWQFACAASQPPTAENGYCENCGYRGIERDLNAVRPGQRVLLDRWTLRWRPPRRWEIAVASIRNRLTAKRVVGLPGETLEIKDGDVFADGQRVYKSVEQMRRMGVLVHDQRFRPALQADLAPGWQHSPSSMWRPTGHGFRLTADNSLTGSVISADAVAPWTCDITAECANSQWLYFQYRSTLPPPAVAGRDMPICDSYAVNQSVSRTLHRVPDVWCTADLQFAGQAALVLRVANGHGEWSICWEPAAGKVRLLESGAQVATGHTSAPGGHLPLIFGACDGHILFAIGRDACLRYRYEPSASHTATSRPLAIAAVSGEGLAIDNLQIWRDVYYYLPESDPGGWRVHLDAEQFLLLGDNSPMSIDARAGARFGVVERSNLSSLVR